MSISSQELYQNAVESARLAGLRYVSDQQPGIQRQRWGRGFSYLDPDGTRIQDPQRRARFEALVIPPSWEDVWICPEPNGHLQATGRDQRGRKQYRYHPDWVKLRNQIKFDRLIPFAQALPTLREITQQQIQTATLDRETVIAAVVQLLDRTLIRVGNLQYSQTNGSYGLTTLRDRHVDIEAGCIKLQFRGKSGVDHEIDLQNPRLAKIVKQCKEIPGYTLFQYFDEAGHRQTVDSGDINEYLQTQMGDAFTAKDFRTWGGTVTACRALYEIGQTIAKHPDQACVTQAIKAAAQLLGNRPATCRKYYVHPHVVEAYQAGWLLDFIAQYQADSQTALKHLDEDEHRVLAILQSPEVNRIPLAA
ncbi:MAG: DNA topoisomerase IB [Cyanobacteria bacterium P01_A01_bin.114]